MLREKYNDKMSKMASGDLGLYDELFAYACPKFITPCPPSFDGGDVIQEAFRLQLDLFLQEVSALPFCFGGRARANVRLHLQGTVVRGT